MTSYRTLLRPLTLPYEVFARIRAWSYRKGISRTRRLPGVVISVGNLTVGGTGKTPFVIWLANGLLDRGKRVAVLTRGYRGKFHGILRGDLVTQLNASPGLWSRLSDETRILEGELCKRADAAIGVGPSRFATGSELASAGFNWFVLDDGFQHLQLARDLDILLIDATNPFGGGHLLPSGGLREPRAALRRADIIVITRSIHSPAVEAIVRRHSSAPIYYATLKGREVTALEGSNHGVATLEPPRNNLFAFSAIGNPAAFFDNLHEWGLQIVGHASFPDHHKYSRADVDRLEARGRAAGADALICTRKDEMNLHGVAFRTLPVWVCSASLEVHDADGFWVTASEILSRKRPEFAL